ncbi:hypothetical protein TNCV_1204331 [Trichonephila clavipes]|nr:hypothetical protein TNCV_1204331 [Trichonephila clavipes]
MFAFSHRQAIPRREHLTYHRDSLYGLTAMACRSTAPSLSSGCICSLLHERCLCVESSSNDRGFAAACGLLNVARLLMITQTNGTLYGAHLDNTTQLGKDELDKLMMDGRGIHCEMGDSVLKLDIQLLLSKAYVSTQQRIKSQNKYEKIW